MALFQILRIILPITAFIVCFLGMRYFLKSQNNSLKLLIKSATALNSKCPVEIDHETRLDKVVSGPGLVITYFYTLFNLEKDDSELEDFKFRMEQQLIENIKSSNEMAFYRENNIHMVYNYYDKNGSEVAIIIINAGDYNELR